MNSKTGCLYVVATPIGNLDDISKRAITVLAKADQILAEDTRHSRKLLSYYGIATKPHSLHEQNEAALTPRIIARLKEGANIALISDAGTPLISDPGFYLVRAARQNGISVSPLPGVNAAITALSVSGIAAHRFGFEGFLPAKPSQRIARLEQLKREGRTLVFYESCHRIIACLDDMMTCFGADIAIFVAREMTKKFESFYYGQLDQVRLQISEHAHDAKGEFVIVLSEYISSEQQSEDWRRAVSLVDHLRGHVSPRIACKIAGETFSISHNRLYDATIRK